MNRSKRELDTLIERTAAEIHDQVPDDDACRQAAERALAAATAKLADAAAAPAPIESVDPVESIGGCDDVRALLPAYVAGELSEPKALLVQDHTRECLPCRRAVKIDVRLAA